MFSTKTHVKVKLDLSWHETMIFIYPTYSKHYALLQLMVKCCPRLQWTYSIISSTWIVSPSKSGKIWIPNRVWPQEFGIRNFGPLLLYSIGQNLVMGPLLAAKGPGKCSLYSGKPCTQQKFYYYGIKLDISTQPVVSDPVSFFP